MPTETFNNLPKDKQEAIIRAAVAEFAKSAYEQASLTKIVAQAGIAKGSMYQYFENKRELYLYILNMAYAEKKRFLQGVFDEDDDFFATLKRYYRRSYLFAKEFPLYHRVITHYWDYCAEFDQEIRSSRELRANEFIGMLEAAIENRQANPDIDKDAAFFVYHSVGKELIENFLELSEDVQEQHLQFIDQVLDVLALGLKKRKE
ncbi:MAG TPA: TetR/AcrR family transcriptional regulator [Firmicutes bacterium]|nr:TetR/AcrR family transcriptional regulator [Bacillota bacterium]